MVRKMIMLIMAIALLAAYNNVNSQIISGDNVNVRNEPNNGSEVLFKLKLGNKVSLIRRSGKKEKINNNEGEWVYIDTNYLPKGKKEISETIKGWVFDYYLLSDFSKFIRVSKLKFGKCIFECDAGDSICEYELFEDGTYIAKEGSSYPGEEKVSSYKGTIYQYKRLILLKTLYGDNDTVFFINEDGYLCTYGIDKVSVKLTASSQKVKHEINCLKKEAVHEKLHTINEGRKKIFLAETS